MYGIELLVEEHNNVLFFTDILRKVSALIVEGKEVEVAFLRECVDFGRDYSENQHHGKEEKILFQHMLDKLGPVAEKLIRTGMLVEHDLGRYYMAKLLEATDKYETDKSMEVKLDIICHATGYADLLRRHIDKENTVVYTFAERMLSDEDKEMINKETEEFEKEASENNIQVKYTTWLKEAANKLSL
ncbi:Hemerythrin-like domain-containing protein [Lachnospiraceae bacterium C7]|nr:Hemerythrin-like domain-containing protein [Lachnospiraceae bacterium C7]